jgi:hypothetical protein
MQNVKSLIACAPRSKGGYTRKILLTGMKVKIDKFYSENYGTLVLAAKRRITQLKKNIEPESLVSSSYLYVVGKADTITEDEIPRLAFGFILLELIRTNSQTNLKERINPVDLDFDISDTNNQSENLVLKIDIDDFVNTLNRVDQIIFEVYFDKGKRTKRDLAEHFNIDPSSALIYINDIKTKFRNYVKDKRPV